jgi:antitoxin component YwqK of YwqJK toxin-antitoxin module
MKSISILLLFINFSFAQSDTNKLDENGKKHGPWKGFFEESKRLRYEGTFEHGKEIGTFNYYNDTKAVNIIGVRVFSSKDNSAYTTFYDQKKNIVSEGKVIDKLKEGIWKYYHEASKVIMTLENYKLGKIDGLKTIYYKDGKIAEETNYSNGIKNGVYKNFSEKGVLIEFVSYKNDEYDGLATYKDISGKITAQGIFKDGKKIGIWKFYTDGKLVKSENFNKQGKKFQKKIKV